MEAGQVADERRRLYNQRALRSVAPPSPYRRLLWLACAWLTLTVLAAPAALGSAVGPVLRELGANAVEHVCKCGMAPGKCGCPECAHLEEQRLRERLPNPISTLKRQCDDDAPLLPFAAVPGPMLAATSTTVLPVPTGERLPVEAISATPAPRNQEPPTPPPRIASV
jgi:hypothetical protein